MFFTEKHPLLGWDQVTYLPEQYPVSLLWETIGLLLQSKGTVPQTLSLCCEVLSKQICNILLNLSSVAIYASEFPLLLVSACPCHHIASTMFKTRCGVYQVMRCSFLSPYHSHHSCISQSWFYLSKDFFSRTVQALLVIFFSKVSSWVWPVFCTL